MSTTSEVVAAWDTLIWQHSDITNITPNIFNFDLITLSTKEYARLRYEQIINAFFYTVNRAERLRLMGQREQRFDIRISYYLQADIAGDKYAEVNDRFETLDATVRSELGSKWANTVDYYRNQEGPVSIVTEQLENRPVYKATYSYTGFKNL